MRKYELMYIANPQLDPEKLKGLVANLSNVITSNGGSVLSLKEIGLKDLAYEINKHRKGYYVWMLVEASPEAIAEYKRVVNITESVIRNIEVKEGE
ncbi:30S ribosomal protein S6 [Acholeplasma laidlawii]|uniref:Small ribosomal subunit protein bS6 n=2 Tax=Acholeplasma laidlawii TaxID=2148 RepID=RS6_ACHLI|nr:30S ribosomal protein S6 [Acholeplasma laidlawii]A9NEN9.1 RecName: Full=Small ribosomal subunit protein bS6; AltName: Full=30S ribosomal protein S6 [Acholeplasma laidlawii PG-8A]ABX80819.1 small subunit ribosomal protein S6 [Acholeplasma laidlawii PG-8A]NWH10622.1 30S ribosomal protein S6 [Acholeplasma laidlawii]NWH12007.1 30S ribosomal protein S6 [Acholeplasma laidlawii]NWH12584.1 30S ribosomal protein S6 [Acholeplasma laidlawii]NWH14782.1 30S ribosomal protein S6 [Acholeplasma laidlawii]